MKQILIATIALLSIAGCSVNEKFVYKPSAPVAGVQKLPVKVAVVAFQDGTEDFTKRGSVFIANSLTFNLAKAGVGSGITALTPDLWAKAFADDLAASGSFRSVRFIYNMSELADEDFYVEGTLEKAYLVGSFERPNEFAVVFRALRRTDNRLSWEKEITRKWNLPRNIYEGCGSTGSTNSQCMADRGHAYINGVMQGMFAEAGVDLVKTLASLSGSRVEEDEHSPVASPAPPTTESVNGEIERILKGN